MAEGFPFDRAPDGYAEVVPYPKADLLERFIAKAIDLLITGALFAFPGPVGALAGALYILVSDGFNSGQSVGKRLIGLKAVSVSPAEGPCNLKQSIIRNSPFGALILLYIIIGWIPYLGPLIVAIAAAAIAVFECALIYTDERGLRFGDRIAGTQVVEGAFTKLP